jgi:hypothetical protein
MSELPRASNRSHQFSGRNRSDCALPSFVQGSPLPEGSVDLIEIPGVVFPKFIT